MRRRTSPTRNQQHHARYTETLGLIVIAILIFIIVLARYFRSISWSWR